MFVHIEAPPFKMQRVGPLNPHRSHTPGPSYPPETAVSRKAPYACKNDVTNINNNITITRMSYCVLIRVFVRCVSV